MIANLTPDEIEQLRIWHLEDSPARLHRAAQRKIVASLLQAHDLVERLRNLQADDVTEKDRDEWMGEQWVHHDCLDRHRGMIAAAVRVVVASLDKSADTA